MSETTGPADSLTGGERKEEEDVQNQSEEAVSAAVGMVVASARHGVITLCASVAHIIREKMRLEQKVSELERKVSVLESNNSSSDSGAICHSGSQGCSLPESPLSLRCGSAPPSFLSSPARKLSGNDRHIVQEVCQNCESGGTQFCTACRERQTHQRNSPSSPWAKKDELACGFLRSKSTDANANRKESVCGFSRGHAHSSTRSLNLHRAPSLSRFMRRKYSTISLRRVQRAGLSSKGSSSGTLSQQSISNSSGSQEWGEDGSRRGSSSSRSYVVTVAEVYTPPSPPHLPHKTSESAAVKLLARKLASVMQEDEFEEERTPRVDGSDSLQPPLSPLSTMPTQEFQDLCAPHPLSGCECVVCMRVLSDPSCAVYSITTSEGMLLPRGSTVLIRGDMIGTVLYFGHRRQPLPNRYVWYQPPPDSSPTHVPTSSSVRSKGAVSETDVDDCSGGSDGTEVTAHPLGVTVTLWPPDQGEIFVPLSDVVCQLNEEEEMESQDYPCSSTQEDSPICTLQSDLVHIDRQSRRESFNNADLKNSNQPDTSLPLHVESWTLGPQNHPIVSSVTDTQKNNVYAMEDSVNHDPCVEALNPCTVQRLGDVSDCDENIKNSEESFSLEVWDKKDIVLSGQQIGGSCFTGMYSYHSTNSQKNLDDHEPEVSLYDTSDSAISLNSSKRPHKYQKTAYERGPHQLSHPSSLTELDRDSPHFGDTWDSGCYVRRERYGSLSSEQLSDVEYDGSHQSHLRSSWAQTLQDEFDIMWERYHGTPFSSGTDDGSRPSTDYRGSDSKSGRDFLVTNAASGKPTIHVSDYSVDCSESVSGSLCSNPKKCDIVCPPVKSEATFGYNYTKTRVVEDYTSDKTTHTMDSGVLGLKNYSNVRHSKGRRHSSVQLYFLDNCSVDDSVV